MHGVAQAITFSTSVACIFKALWFEALVLATPQLKKQMTAERCYNSNSAGVYLLSCFQQKLVQPVQEFP